MINVDYRKLTLAGLAKQVRIGDTAAKKEADRRGVRIVHQAGVS